MCGLEVLCSRTVQFIVSLFLEDTQTLEFLKTVMMIIIERCIVAKKKNTNILAVILGQLY